jgi:hypothetical protein
MSRFSMARAFTPRGAAWRRLAGAGDGCRSRASATSRTGRVGLLLSAGLAGTGHLIGALERFLALTLALLGQWGALGFIVAAKSIARFKELEDRRFAEYYLVGTLTSIIVATTTGLLVRALLARGQ